MEIQFSVAGEAQASSSNKESSSNSAARQRAAPSSAGRGGGSGRGGTFRFALDSRTKHTRKSSSRARSGCNTCKKRHVKCDETKPSCQNCMKWRGYCDSYNSEDTVTPRQGSIKAKLIHTKRAPTLIVEPLVNTIRFSDGDQCAYFEEWTKLSVQFLSGGLVQTRLWVATMPQVSVDEIILRYAAMAVGALRKAESLGPLTSAAVQRDRHYINAVVYYCEALRLQSRAKPSKEGLRTALLSSLLFICFETLRGNIPVALKHIVHGFSMLNELAACSDNAPDLVSIAQAPPALVEEILDCYKPLELQSRSFMGSYKKYFFPPSATPPMIAPPRGPSPATSLQSSAVDQTLQSLPIRSPASQPGTPWQASTPPQPAGSLPSPQSQGSPHAEANRQTAPPEGPPGSQTPPQRPPGIAPFTKHSPYFRPKKSTITSLEQMPSSFASYDEAYGYWNLVQRQMVVSLPLLTRTTAQLALTKAVDEADLEARLASVKKNPKISAFIAESRYWLARWIEAFNPHYQAASANAASDTQSYLQAVNLRVEYLILYIYTAIPRYSGLVTAKGLTPQYREINVLAEILLSARPHCGFSMDSGFTWPLFISAFACRDKMVREDAIRVLDRFPIRNALRDSTVFKAIALKSQEVEAANISEGDENDHWLRLRRRELVFEDFGANIIFRYADKNTETGLWELVEEVAEFTVGPDGKLDWRRQPISDAASILSGVC